MAMCVACVISIHLSADIASCIIIYFSSALCVWSAGMHTIVVCVVTCVALVADIKNQQLLYFAIIVSIVAICMVMRGAVKQAASEGFTSDCTKERVIKAVCSVMGQETGQFVIDNVCGPLFPGGPAHVCVDSVAAIALVCFFGFAVSHIVNYAPGCPPHCELVVQVSVSVCWQCSQCSAIRELSHWKMAVEHSRTTSRAW